MAHTVIAQSNLEGTSPVVWVYDDEDKTHRVLTNYCGHKFFKLAVDARARFNEELSIAWTEHAIHKGIY